MSEITAAQLLTLTAEQAAITTHIYGHAFFGACPHPLPMLERISGNAHFRGYTHPLPALASINGDAYFKGYSHPLPALAYIGGNARVKDYPHPLPMLSHVGGRLSLDGYGQPLSDALLQHIPVPIVPLIDVQIADAIAAGAGLDMEFWHYCGTSHCRAGWAIILAGAAGAELEQAVGPEVAGFAIYQASRPGVPAPDFFASRKAALSDILRCAVEQRASIG